MSLRKKRWLMGIAAALALTVVAASIFAWRMSKRLEPMVREQALRYMRERFHSDVELRTLHIHLPKISMFAVLLRRERGAKVRVDGDELSMRFAGSRDRPPLFSIRKFAFEVDLASILEERKIVDEITIDGMEITLPPKSSGAKEPAPPTVTYNVLIEKVGIKNAVLVIPPKDPSKKALKFAIESLHLSSVGANTAMKYDAQLTIPKPPGQIHCHGSFGPWSADEPGDTLLDGDYTFDRADLGIFNGIVGTLSSSGTFRGSLSAVNARGQATVPDFSLKMTGTPVPLTTQFEVLVDGTNGNTILQPVKARLGQTNFTTSGAVIKHEGENRRAITLAVVMPNGDLRDLLRLAVKGPPFMEGRIMMKTKIDIPPLSSKVKQKLVLDGQFDVHDAKFLRSTIQDQIDQLSRRGQGQPSNQSIDEVVSRMKGSFHLENQVMTFRQLAFEVPGAWIQVSGNYDLKNDTLDFHGTLRLVAKVSQTMTGWKRWLLKPVDPFFSKNGAGTFLKIKVEGPSRQPKFGLDR